MAKAFTMPKFGMTMEEGTVVRWVRREGEVVKAGETIVEVETDKAVMDVESDASGTLLRIVTAEGETVPCGTTLAYIGEPGEPV